ncbi:hypothetical protein Agub_g12421 [Astrephomene gubernaculifera]|uniref:Uncharacterized protein n=1 Tax=Astrephomene gubernaculifera TaxID=47775 RepID=A0AAD3DZT9_9CHLO|nr:hypothetical protein Agub_g12421 [Astrephomene gubernaculifera]
MACCGPTNGLRDNDDWRYPRTLQWKRLVTGDDVPLLLAPSYDRPLLPATTAEVPNPLHTRSAQQWFTGLPDDTARAIMQTRRSMLREQQIVDTVMSMNPKPLARDPRPSPDLVFQHLAATQQHMAALAAARGLTGSRGLWSGGRAGPAGQRPGTAPPAGAPQGMPYGTTGMPYGFSQPSTPHRGAPLLQPGGLPPPVMSIIAQQQQQQQQQGQQAGQTGGRIAAALRSITPFKSKRPQSAPAPPGQMQQMQQQQQLQQHMVPQQPLSPQQPPMYPQQQQPHMLQQAPQHPLMPPQHPQQHLPQPPMVQQQQQPLMTVASPQQQQQQPYQPGPLQPAPPPQQQQQQQFPMHQPGMPLQQQQQLQAQAMPQPHMPQQPPMPPQQPPPPQPPMQGPPPDSAGPSSPWYKRMWRRGGGTTTSPGPGPDAATAATVPAGFQPQGGQTAFDGTQPPPPQQQLPLQPLQGPQAPEPHLQHQQLLGVDPQQRQQLLLQPWQQQQQPQVAAQAAMQQAAYHQQQQQQQGVGPMGRPQPQSPQPSEAAMWGAMQHPGMAPLGQQQQQQPQPQQLQLQQQAGGVMGSRLPYPDPQAAMQQQQQHRQPLMQLLPPPPPTAMPQPVQPPPAAAPLLSPPLPPGPVLLPPPRMPYNDDAAYGLDEELVATTAAPPPPLPPPSSLPPSRPGAALTNFKRGGGNDFGLGADVAEAEAATAPLPPPAAAPLLRPPSLTQGPGGSGMLRPPPPPLSYNHHQDPYDVPEEALEATAAAAEQRLGMAPPSLRRAQAPAPLPALSSGLLPAPRRLQRRPSMDGPAGDIEDVEEDFGLGAEVEAANTATMRPAGLPPARQLAAVGGPAPEVDFSFGARQHPGGPTPKKIAPVTRPLPAKLSPPRFNNEEIVEEDF